MQRALESRASFRPSWRWPREHTFSIRTPFPDEQIFLHVIALRAPQAFLSFKYIYYMLLFTTPYLVCSTVLSGLYIFTLKARQMSRRGAFPNILIQQREMTYFLLSAKFTTRANRCPPRLPIGLRFPSAVCSPESPSWEPLVSGKTPAACTRSRSRFLPTKPTTKRSASAG